MEQPPEEDPGLQRLDVVSVGRISALDVNGKPGVLDGNAICASMRMKVRDNLVRCTRPHARMSVRLREFPQLRSNTVRSPHRLLLLIGFARGPRSTAGAKSRNGGLRGTKEHHAQYTEETPPLFLIPGSPTS